MNIIQSGLSFIERYAQDLSGLLVVCIIVSMFAILFFQQCVAISKRFVRPAIEHGFYNRILDTWLGPFLSKHKIIATFIRIQGLGDTVVDAIACISGTFFVVAMLSSATTAFIIEVLANGFHYSLYVVFLVASMSMLTWVLGWNMLYFYKLAHRLK
jgi:hypothetical protein